MLDNNLLEYLLVYYEEGSLLKASERLHISQPSLSKAMQKLENELDVCLFERKANKISLNEIGKELLPYMKDIKEMDERLYQKAKELKDKENTISIGYSAPGPLYRFQSLFAPSKNVSRIISKLDNEENLIKGLSNNVYDIIFINHPYNDTKFICKKVMNERLYVYVPNTHFLYEKNDGVYWKDIDKQTFLLFSYVGVWDEILKLHLKNSRFVRLSSQDDLKELAEYSSIPSFVSSITKDHHIIENRKAIPILDTDASMDFYVLLKKNKEKLLNFLR